MITVKFNDKELTAMANKITKNGYSKAEMAKAGQKIIIAYENYMKLKKAQQPNENQMTLEEAIKIMEK